MKDPTTWWSFFVSPPARLPCGVVLVVLSAATAAGVRVLVRVRLLM